MYAIGDNTYGEIGIDDSSNTNKVKEVKFFHDLKYKNSNSDEERQMCQISKIAAGARNSLVLLKNGHLYAFGDNSDGQCTAFSIRYPIPTKINFEQKERIIDVFCGYNHCMILLGKIFYDVDLNFFHLR